MKLPRITYHSETQPLPGSYIVPQGPRSHAAYLVHGAREVMPRIPRDHKVWMLDVERIGKAAVPADGKVHPLYWFIRDRKPRPGERGAP